MSDNDSNDVNNPHVDLNNPHVDETVIMSLSDIKLHALEEDATTQALENPTKPLGSGGKRELMLIVRGMVERVKLSEENEIKLGRFEPASRQEYEIDLTPYGAMDRGVSRFHARIYLEGDQLFVIDNKSTNGTYIGNVKVVPHVATVLGKGAELILGRLPIQVMLR